MRLTNKPIHGVLAYFYNNIILIFQSFFSCSFLSFFIFFNKNGKTKACQSFFFHVFLFFFCSKTNFWTNFLFFILEEKKFIFFPWKFLGNTSNFFRRFQNTFKKMEKRKMKNFLKNTKSCKNNSQMFDATFQLMK